MNPILLSRQVEAGLKNLVRSSFSSTGAGFEGTIDRFLSEDSNYIKGPWVSVALPFARANSDETEHLFPLIPLGFPPYRHQLNAFTRLSGARPRSTLVATGTGSGKTEAYLWPILEHCRQHKDQPGIKAILIYPMNALASDQARRIAKTINRIPALQGVRAGIYADKEPQFPTDEMTEEEVITRRKTMLSDPPDILLTNYKMLDYLLLREKDQQLWKNNDAHTLRFLVVDELHTFDGAQGADLALLIRRLKARLQTPDEHLVCVGSSATLGTGQKAEQELRNYAEIIFGEEFDDNAVVREVRKPIDQVFEPPEYFDWPEPQEVARALDDCLKLDQAETARRLALCLFPQAADPDLDALHEGDPNDVEWRLKLGDLLPQHIAIQRILRILAASNGPAHLDDLAEELAQVKTLAPPKWDGPARRKLVELAISLISWARQGPPERPEPLYGVRVQMWIRELARMVFSIPSLDENGKLEPSELRHGHDITEAEARRMLPVVHCSRCGTSGHIGRIAARSNRLWAELDVIYEDFFDGNTDRLRLIYYEAISRKAGTTGAGIVISGYLDSHTLAFRAGDHDPEHQGGDTPVWIYNPTNERGKLDRTCPACGQGQSLVLFGLRAARITAGLTSILYASEHNEEDPAAKPRFLMFSDSVQDAAHRAAVTEHRNNRSVIRKSLHSALKGSETAGMSLADVVSKLPGELRRQMGDEAFAARFTAFDQTWDRAFERLQASGSIEGEEAFLRRVQIRLGWEYFSDLTYRSHNSQTLENLGLAVADVLPGRVEAASLTLARIIRRDLPSYFSCSEEQARYFLSGFLQQMRRRGAVGHEYLEGAIISGSQNKPFNYFGAAQAMGLGKTGALPVPDYRGSRESRPTPVTLKRSIDGFQFLARDHSTNWYRDWADKFFIHSLSTLSGYDDFWEVVLRALEVEAIIKKVEQRNSPINGYLIEPDAIAVSTEVVYLSCNACGRREVTLADSLNAQGGPCTRIACRGQLMLDDDFRDRFAEDIFETDRNHRVIAREHTGMLEAETRREIERGFIKEDTPWSPNLISATPTLEMGIDIGDLSTLLLCSVPPEEANYIQRIGRTGRRDGNSLNLTIAAARPHDLQFWEDPVHMLSGEVRAPGVNISALAVLLRQAAAYSLDRFVAENNKVGDYGKVRAALSAIARENTSAFPLNWFNFLRREGASLASDFLALLPDQLSAREDIHKRIEEYFTTSGDQSLVWQVASHFEGAKREKGELIKAREALDNAAKRLRYREAEFTKEELQKRLDNIRKDKAEINQMIRRTIDEVRVLRFLTDRGVLPNYAFPEEGVKLKSVIFQSTEGGQQRIKTADDNMRLFEYVRPSSAALSELALGQTFYADGRQMKINRLDINHQDIEKWRFCQSCSHVALERDAANQDACPRCGDEMWSDTGSVHECAKLNTVITVSSEQKASIRDADDRQQRRYDRSLVPFYGDEDVVASWYAPAAGGAAPFGFEYIANCTFRDFNFGPRRDAPSGENRIAGEDRRSAPFRICRHCGSLQNSHQDEGQPGEHQPRCEAMRRELDREEWEARIFLMREFKTEAIRVLVPVPGEASDDDIKSFVSAIDLGMRRYFSGRVDHIRSSVLESQIDGLVKLRSLYFYDAVPGGSGYLRQLAEHPDSFREVIEKAAQALRDCLCAAVGGNGCFRCVTSYRSQFGPGEPDRAMALSMMESILAVWDGLSSVEKDINTRIRNHLLESKLEALFLDALEEEFGKGSLTPMLFEGARRGFQLNVQSKSGQQLFWSIEPQVQINRRFLNMPERRVDFLISPIGSDEARPIVVEMDGLAFHKDTIAEDLLTRLQMIRSGHVRVWTLGWRDLEQGRASHFPNPFSKRRLGEGHADTLNRIVDRLDLTSSEVDSLNLLQEGTSLDGLLRYLKNPSFNLGAAISVMARSIVGRGRELDTLPRVMTLSPDSQDFLMDSPMAGHCSDTGIHLYLTVGKVKPPEWSTTFDDCRFLLRGYLPDLRDGQPDTLYTEAWRGLWRMVNFLQDMKGFHLEFEGVETLSAPSMADTASSAEEQGWLETREMVLDEYLPLVNLLIAQQVPAPDMLGEDITDATGRMVGTVEMGWSEKKVAVSAESFTYTGWTILNFAADEPAVQASKIIRLLGMGER